MGDGPILTEILFQRAVKPKITNDQLHLCRTGLDDVSRARMTTLAFILTELFSLDGKGWSGGAMVLGKLPVPGRPTIWMTVGQGPILLAGGDCLDIFTLVCPSLFSLSSGDGPI